MNEETSWAKWMHNVGMLDLNGWIPNLHCVNLTHWVFLSEDSNGHVSWDCREAGLSPQAPSPRFICLPHRKGRDKGWQKSAFSGLPGGNVQASADRCLTLDLLQCTVWEWCGPGQAQKMRVHSGKWERDPFLWLICGELEPFQLSSDHFNYHGFESLFF